MKNIFNKALFVENIKQTLAFTIFTLLMYGLIFANLQQNVTNSHGSNRLQGMRQMANLLVHNHPGIVSIVTIMPFILTMILNRHMFFRKNSIFVNTLPLSKKQVLFTTFLTGTFIFTIVLLIFAGLLLTLPPVVNTETNLFFWQVYSEGETFPFFTTINSFSNIAAFVGRLFLSNIFYMAMFTLVAVLAGNLFVFILLCGFFVFGPIFLHYIAGVVAQRYLFGFNLFSLPYTDIVFAVNNPAGYFYMIRRGNGFLFSIIYIILGIVFFIFANYLYKKRKQELTGDSIVFSTMKHICIWFFAFFGIILGAGFMNIFVGVSAHTNITFIISWIVFYIFACWIANKSFNFTAIKLKPTIVHATITIVLYVVMRIVVVLPMIPYNRIPDPNQIAGIFVNNRINSVFWGSTSWGGASARVTSTDPELITMALNVHQIILDNRSYLHRFEQELDNRRSFVDVDFYELTLEYITHDGQRIRRDYSFPLTFAHEHGINEFLQNPRVVLGDIPTIFYPENINFLEIEMWHATEGRTIENRRFIFNPEQIESLTEAIIADTIRGRSIDFGSVNNFPFVMLVNLHVLTTDIGSVSEAPSESLLVFTDGYYVRAWIADNLN